MMHAPHVIGFSDPYPSGSMATKSLPALPEQVSNTNTMTSFTYSAAAQDFASFVSLLLTDVC